MLKKIDHIGIVVSDIAAARALYEGTLGMEVVRERTTERVRIAFLRLGNSEIELLEYIDPGDRAAKLQGQPAGRLDHIAFEVDDLETCIADLKLHGVVLADPIRGPVSTSVLAAADSTGGVKLQFVERLR